MVAQKTEHAFNLAYPPSQLPLNMKVTDKLQKADWK